MSFSVNNQLRKAKLFEKSGHFSQAKECYQSILQKFPKNSAAAKGLEKLNLAYQTNRVEVSQSDIAELMNLYHSGLLDETVQRCQNLLQIYPQSAHALTILGMAFLGLNQDKKALSSFDKAIAINPDFPFVYSHRSIALQHLGRFKEAVESCTSAIKLKPDYCDAHYNLGVSLQALGYVLESIQSYNKALQYEPLHAKAHKNKALMLLLLGDFENGWKEYEWRWKTDHTESKQIETSKPIWQPECKGRKLLIWPEQGVGDEVMFCTLLSKVPALVPEILVQVDSRLIPLFKRSIPDLTFLPKNVPVNQAQYDCHLPMGSLPRYLFNQFDAPSAGYLASDALRTKEIIERLRCGKKKTIGISWKTKNSESSKTRNIDLANLVALFANMDVQLINLQYGDVSDEINRVQKETGIKIAQYEAVDNFYDLDGFASLIDACDLVITIDNSTVHLAGALGKPTWVMLSYMPNWRWLLGRNTTHWYSSVRLFRQTSADAWDSVFIEVQKMLSSPEWQANEQIQRIKQPPPCPSPDTVKSNYRSRVTPEG